MSAIVMAGQYPDLIRELIPSKLEEVWVSDIIYFRTKDDFIYGHLITDGYSKKFVGFEVSENMKAPTTLLA
jgi:transposase InsO family protein